MQNAHHSDLVIRAEQPGDLDAIRALVLTAFQDHPHHVPGAAPTEHKIVDELRRVGELSLSLVGIEEGHIVGHIAFSPVRINDLLTGWYGLGPVAVDPVRQRSGIGSAIIRHGLTKLRNDRAAGVVLVGNPTYYNRFGFHADSRLHYADVPPEYFLTHSFSADIPSGIVTFHPAFAIT